jgi:hypothetical protein
MTVQKTHPLYLAVGRASLLAKSSSDKMEPLLGFRHREHNLQTLPTPSPSFRCHKDGILLHLATSASQEKDAHRNTSRKTISALDMGLVSTGKI